MKKYLVYGQILRTQFLGEVEADSKEAAESLGWKLENGFDEKTVDREDLYIELITVKEKLDK